MPDKEKEIYRGALNRGTLSYESLNQLLAFFEDKKMCLENVPKQYLKQMGVSSLLNRLELRVCYGKRSWKGLIIGFPGNRDELSTKYVGTPYLRVILYPILDLYIKLQQQSAKPMPCRNFISQWIENLICSHIPILQDLLLT